MSIIEKEIVRREALISDNYEKAERVVQLRATADALQAEVEEFNEEALKDEIKELETYLVPKAPGLGPGDDEIVAESFTTFGTSLT